MNNFLIDEKVKSEICDLYKAGQSLEKLRRRLGITIPRIRRVLEARDIPYRQRSEAAALSNTMRVLDDEMQGKLCQLYRDGHSMEEIRLMTRIPRTTIERTLNRHGVEMRSRGAALKLARGRRR